MSGLGGAAALGVVERSGVSVESGTVTSDTSLSISGDMTAGQGVCVFSLMRSRGCNGTFLNSVGDGNTTRAALVIVRLII